VKESTKQRTNVSTKGKETPVATFKELRIYQNAMDACMGVFKLSKRFPSEERFSLTDQIRRASRSVCANLAEAWRRRRYPAAFVAKLTDCSGEASEIQVWLEIAHRCGYLEREQTQKLDDKYEHIGAQLLRMIQEPEKWQVRNGLTNQRISVLTKV
jgi:four helix bundle protein